MGGGLGVQLQRVGGGLAFLPPLGLHPHVARLQGGLRLQDPPGGQPGRAELAQQLRVRLDPFRQAEHAEAARGGRRLGPFDVTLVESGQYNWQWPDWHTGPEQAVLAHRWVRGRTFIPVHWALFKLAPHGWTEPGERTLAAAACQGVTIATPRPGVPWEPGDSTAPWWPRDLPWLDARQRPIVATRDGNAAHRYPVPACVRPVATAAAP